jgi:uncharacterized RDD family membrane protein YckC
MSPVGFWLRFLAGIIDAIVISLAAGLLRVIGLPLSQGVETNAIVLTLYHFLVPYLWQGYTVGKRFLKIRITTMSGEKPGAGSLLIRSLVLNGLYALTIGILLLVSCFMVGLRADRRSIHDLLAGTQVLRNDGGYDAPGNL